jgi:hypothetical protein
MLMYLDVFWCPFVIYLPMPEQESENAAIIAISKLTKTFKTSNTTYTNK